MHLYYFIGVTIYLLLNFLSVCVSGKMHGKLVSVGLYMFAMHFKTDG